MPLAEPGLVVLEDDVECPVQAVFDGPVAAHGLASAFGGQESRGDVVARLEAASVTELGARGDADQAGDCGETKLPGEATVAGEPGDVVGDRDGSFLDAAVPLVDIDMNLKASLGGVIKEAGDVGAQRRLVRLHRQQVVGPRFQDRAGDGRISHHGVDRDEGAIEPAAVGKALDESRDGTTSADSPPPPPASTSARRSRDEMERCLARLASCCAGTSCRRCDKVRRSGQVSRTQAVKASSTAPDRAGSS